MHTAGQRESCAGYGEIDVTTVEGCAEVVAPKQDHRDACNPLELTDRLGRPRIRQQPLESDPQGLFPSDRFQCSVELAEDTGNVIMEGFPGRGELNMRVVRTNS